MKNKIEGNYILKLAQPLLAHALVLIRILILSLIFIQPPIIAQISEQPIKVMTFNIRYGTANDGENSWQFRRAYVFNVIKNYDPDLIGLQEALDFQNEELLKEFPSYKMIGIGREDGKKAGEFSSILYKKDRFIPDTTETFWFSDTPNIPNSMHWGNNITRICTWALFTDQITNNRFYHYNLHIDHLSQPSREKSTAFLVEKLSNQKEELPIILSGDFNCGDENPAVQNITNRGLIDSYRLLHKKDAGEGTFNSFKGETTGDKIDYIFVSKDFKCVKSEIIRTSYHGKYPSDHFPVSATIILK